ncbi:MAG: VTT domain-containing protein [Minisyncoccia bacterium]
MSDFFTAIAHLDPVAMLRAGGYIGLALVVFAESGLLVGIFLPGDSLLFAAGLLSSNGLFSIIPLILIVVVAAILGDSFGYWFGTKAGENLFNRKDSLFFKQEYLERTERFYQEYGGRAIILARFVPIVRTIAPVLAGVGSMKYRTFLSRNVIGGLAWGAGMTLLGFSLGSIIPDSEKYVLPLSLVIIVISFFPIILNLIRNKRTV